MSVAFVAPLPRPQKDFCQCIGVGALKIHSALRVYFPPLHRMTH